MGRARRKRPEVPRQLRLDGAALEWIQEHKGLYRAVDIHGAVRAHVLMPEDGTGWWRALIEGESLPFDQPTFAGIQDAVEQHVREQDEQQQTA